MIDDLPQGGLKHCVSKREDLKGQKMSFTSARDIKSLVYLWKSEWDNIKQIWFLARKRIKAL